MHRSSQRVNKTDWFFVAFILNARLAIRQRADSFEANISANKISLTQGQSYTAFACSHVAKSGENTTQSHESSLRLIQN